MDPLIGSALIGAGGSALGSIFSGRQAASFAERSYKHRYQWQVKDMQKAGINPMLAFSQGAPNVPQPNFPNLGEALGKGAQAGVAAFSAKQQANVSNSVISLNQSASAKNAAEADRALAEADAIRGKTPVEIEKMRTDTMHIVEQINSARTTNEQLALMLQLERAVKAATVQNLQAGIPPKVFLGQIASLASEVLKSLRDGSAKERAGSLFKDTANFIDDKLRSPVNAYKEHIGVPFGRAVESAFKNWRGMELRPSKVPR